MDNDANEFADRGLQWSHQAGSMGQTVYYEESPTGSGRDERVLVDGRWTYCPSSELMHPQDQIDGFGRGSRALLGDMPCTVLSVYRVAGHPRACVTVDARTREHDRQGVPLCALRTV